MPRHSCTLVTALFLGLGISLSLAEDIVCLTGNSPDGRNVQLKNGCYRTVWVGTTQPRTLGDPSARGWTPFQTGDLTNGKDVIPVFPDRVQKISRTYRLGPSEFEIEVDLGQVCEIASFRLTRNPAGLILKLYYPKAKRWLPVASGKDKVELKGVRVRQFRVEVHGSTGQMFAWGRPLGPKAEESLPEPLAPKDDAVPYRLIELKPAPAEPLASDPFVFPHPQEMRFGERRLSLGRRASIVLPEKAGDDLRDIADNLAELAATLFDIEIRANGDRDAPKIWLGLAEDAGPCADLAGRLKARAGQIKPEGYALEITEQGSVLVGRDLEGLVWATKALLLLMRSDPGGGVSLPMGTIRDFPRSPYRPTHGYPGWYGEFKAGLLQVMALVKSNLILLEADEVSSAIIRRNRMQQVVNAFLFPTSVSAYDGDFLEKLPGLPAAQLDWSRLSACCSHPDFWQQVIRAFARAKNNPQARFIHIGLDEMFHNPWMVCGRCRARGLTQREMLLDCFMKAYRDNTKRGYKVMVHGTGYKIEGSALEFLLDIPKENVLVHTDERENEDLWHQGLDVIHTQGDAILDIKEDTPYLAGCVVSWDIGDRTAFLQFTVPQMLMQAEENWSADKVRFQSPEWHARGSRMMDLARHLVDQIPMEAPGTKHEYFTADISKHVNRSFRDEVFGDGSGWMDEGPTRDLRHLPTGRQVLKGIPYQIPEKGAVVVAGPGAADGGFPDHVTDITIGQKAGELLFLHTCARFQWSDFRHMVLLLGFYRIRYGDDTFLTVPVNYGQHLLEWNKPFNYRSMEFEPAAEPVPEAPVAWRGSTDGGHDVTLYSMRWRNPYPEKVIKSVDVLASAQLETNHNRISLVAITGRVVEPVDSRIAERKRSKPALRNYVARPPLPEGVVALDLTRRSQPPSLSWLVAPEKAISWQSHDKWFKVEANHVVNAYGELSLGVYSALDPDDTPWRCGWTEIERVFEKAHLTVHFKRPLPLRGIGVKGVLQRGKIIEICSEDLRVWMMPDDEDWQVVGEVKGHVGQEGEARWVFPQETPIVAVKVEVLNGDGISAIHLYGKPDALPDLRFERPPTAEELDQPKKETSDDEIQDEMEGE